MTIYCCFPGCGKSVYEYEKNKVLHKRQSHTIPLAERSGLACKLQLNTYNLKKAQLLLCSAHFRPEAYLPGTTRLRKDVPFSHLLVFPDADPNKPLPPLPPIQPAAMPEAEATPRPKAKSEETKRKVGRPKSITPQKQAEPALPSLLFGQPAPAKNDTVTNAVQTSNASVSAQNQTNANSNFEMKKKRIEATMHFLQKEKDLESRLKTSETEAQLYKSRFESVQVELMQKREEIGSLRSMFQELQNEKNTIKVAIIDTNKQRTELEEKNLLLKGDILFNQELQKARKERLLKRAKSDRSVEVEDETIDSSQDMDEATSVNLAERLRELEEQLRELNERRDTEAAARDKEISDMKKSIKALNSEYQHLYETKMALSTDLMAYRKLIHLEDQSFGGSSKSKKRRTTDSCHDEESEKDESLPGSSASSKLDDH